MRDVYVEKFSALLDDVAGPMHPMVRTYMSALLADHIDKTNFFADPVALRYMALDNSIRAKELGDNCLVIAGMFSGYRGMSDDYYVQIGSGSYYVAANATGSEVFQTLARDFEELKLVLNSIRPTQYLP